MKAAIVPAVLRGEDWISLGITEPGGGSDVANLRTTAVRDGGHEAVGIRYGNRRVGARPSIHDAGNIYNQEVAIKYIATLTKGKTISHTMEILIDYLLPHIGETNFQSKAYYLGYMVNKLLKVLKSTRISFAITWSNSLLSCCFSNTSTQCLVPHSL